MIQKIISGGQTGVDRGALDAAIESGTNCGGWCPPGRKSEDGPIPFRYPLTETPEDRSASAPGIARSLRTEWNVRDTDATLILRPADIMNDKGTDWSIRSAVRYQKPYLIIDPYDQDAVNKIRSWLTSLNIAELNVAGPSEKTDPGIGAQTKHLLMEVLQG